MLDSNLIRWEHITHTLTTSAHLPPDFFRTNFATISESLHRVPCHRLDGIDAGSLLKETMNSLLGFWGKPRHTQQFVETVTRTEDLRRRGPCRKRAVREGLYDYIFEQELLTWTSMRPIHQIVLDMEHVWLATSYRAARTFCTAQQISTFSTDATLVHPSRVQQRKLEDSLLAIQHADGTSVFRVRSAEPRVIVNNTMPATCANHMDQFEFNAPGRNAWCDFYETAAAPAFEDAMRLAQAKQSVFLQGIGGTGKS